MGPSSRPKPERFTPPKGRFAPAAEARFTFAMPTSSWSATRLASSRSVEKTAPPRPYCESLARATASSAEDTL